MVGVLWVEDQILPSVCGWVTPPDNFVWNWILQLEDLHTDGNAQLSCCQFLRMCLELLLAVSFQETQPAIGRLLLCEGVLSVFERTSTQRLHQLLQLWMDRSQQSDNTGESQVSFHPIDCSL